MDTKTHTILFVEDNINVLQALNDYMIGHFFVMSATNGLEALEALKKDGRKIDVIITDIVMPEMDGLDLIKEVEKDYPDIPIIAMTGYGNINPEVINEVTKKAAVFLKKPFEVPELYNHIVKLIEKKNKKKQN